MYFDGVTVDAYMLYINCLQTGLKGLSNSNFVTSFQIQ